MPCELLLVSTGLGLHLAKQAPPPAAILHANSPAFRTWGAAGRVACLRRHDEPPCVPAYLGVVRSVLVGCTRGRDGLDTSILFAVWFLQSANSIFLLHSSSTSHQSTNSIFLSHHSSTSTANRVVVWSFRGLRFNFLNPFRKTQRIQQSNVCGHRAL